MKKPSPHLLRFFSPTKALDQKVVRLYDKCIRLIRLCTLAGSLSFFATDGCGQQVAVLDWVKSTRGGGNDFNRASVGATASDPSGNLYITGSFNYTADFDPGPGVFNLTPVGNGDAFILKLDSDGNFVWAVQFGSTLEDVGNDVAVDVLGNVYFTGEFPGAFDADPGAGVVTITPASRDIIVIKLDSNGGLLWSKQIGSSSFDVGYSLGVNTSGDVYISGKYGGTIDFDPGPGTVNVGGNGSFLLKLTTSGNYVWVKILPSPATYLTIDQSGNVLLTGWYAGSISFSTSSGTVTLTPSGGTDFYVAKFLSDGTNAWAKGIGGTLADESYSITSDLSNNVYITGSFSGSPDFDPGTATFTLTSPGTISVFISKLDANGNFVLAKQFTGGGNNTGYGITVDAAENIYTTGRFRVTTDFDPGPSTYNLTAIGSVIDAFVSKLDNNGNFIWAAQMGGPGTGAEPTGHAINVSGTGQVYTTGVYRLTIDFDPGPCVSNIIGDGGYDVFVQRLSSGTPIPSPTISSFAPTSGLVGTTVIITGTNFSATPANNIVKFFNGKTATVTASTATTITTSVPTGAITGPISVTTNCITVQSATNFIVTVPASPTISSFTPTNGAVGTTVTINGTNFSTTPSNNTVKFNGTTAVVTASTATTITTTVPVSATTGKITVTVSGNTATSSTNFTVTSGTVPTITSFSPTSGPVGTTVVITGTNFSATPANNTVNFYDGIDSYVLTAVVTASTATSITCTVPSGAFTGRIKVTTAGGNATSSTNFTVTCGAMPTITSFSPGSGVVGTVVTITGTNFSTTPTDNIVDFGGYSAVVTASTATSITTTVPTGPSGLVPITITIACNTITSSTDFDVICPPSPTITSFTPATGLVGAVVTITGTNFSTTPANNLIDFNGEPAIVTASTATSITTTVPANAFSGPINIFVGCDGASSTDDFIVDCGPAPTITSFSPAAGPAGTLVTITGTNFSTTPSDNFVDFNGGLANVTSSTSTSITAEVPAGAVSGPITIVINCNYVISNVDFTVNANITITTQPSNFTTCFGLTPTVTFTVAAAGTTNITYQWQRQQVDFTFDDVTDGGAYSGATTPTLTVNTALGPVSTVYRCKVNGDLTSTQISNTASILAVFPPAAPVATGAARCDVGSVSLSASGGSAGQYRWYTVATGGLAIAGETSSTFVTPSAATTTTYYVAVTNGACESSRSPVIATINPLPPKPIVTSSVALTGNTVTICGTSTLTLSAPTGFTSYLWSTGATTSQISVTSAGTYSVVVTDLGCASPASDGIIVTVVPCNNQPPVIQAFSSSTVLGSKLTIELKNLISDTDNNLVLSSLRLVQLPSSGAKATITGTVLELDYGNLPFTGSDILVIEACDALGACTQQQLEIDVVGDIAVYNALSPDGANPNFIIQYIELMPETLNNTVTIFDRWQNQVWKENNYNNNSVVFKGVSSSGADLPTGIYFYRIDFANGRKSRTGFISLKR